MQLMLQNIVVAYLCIFPSLPITTRALLAETCDELSKNMDFIISVSGLENKNQSSSPSIHQYFLYSLYTVLVH